MKIKDNIAEFKIEVIGEQTAQTYLGEFKTKCILSIGDEIEADKAYRNLLGENLIYATQEIKELAFALAQLQVRVVESPFFWNELKQGSQCEDRNLIFEVLNKSIEGQAKFLEEKQQIINEKKSKLTKMLKSGEISEDLPETEEVEGL